VHGDATTVPIVQRRADDQLLRRVRSEFNEMPGLRLTADQAMRLWALDGPTCHRVLDSLVVARFLAQDINGRYRRAHGGY
jgi:DNA-binding IclR family transcriptional regulator